MKNRIAIGMGCATALGLILLGSGMANAITLNEYLFDKGINGTSVYNEIPSGPHHANPIMITLGNPGNLGNLHVAGGPFSNSVPYSSIGMMEIPNPPATLNRWAQDTSGVSLAGLTNFTIEMWVNPVNQPNTQEPINFNGNLMRMFAVAGGYKLIAEVSTSSGLRDNVLGSIVMAPASWYHIAMTYDGSSIKQYVNGTLDGSVTFGTVAGVINGGYAGLYIGTHTAGSLNFFGDIDEIRVSDVALLPGAGTGLNELAWNATLVPEPSSVALIGLAAGWMFSLRRKTRSE